MINDDWTLGQARDWLREHVDDGAPCPLCGQYAKVYRRKLTAHTAVLLIAMYRKAGSNWVHWPSLGLGHADEAKARYWGLIEAKPDEIREDGSSRTGWWRLTALGVAFVCNRITIAKYARIYDGRCLGLRGEHVTIGDVLGTKFNYDHLMDGI